MRLENQTAPMSRNRFGRLLSFVYRPSDNLSTTVAAWGTKRIVDSFGEPSRGAHDMTSRMPRRTFGSVGSLAERSPGATRPLVLKRSDPLVLHSQ